ncbi:MAG: REP-associated tyrosine transposase [Gammaproteobacteria bacterium]
MRYRRANAAGGTFFFTVNLADRSSRALVEQIGALREAVRVAKHRHPFEIVAWSVMPEHLHAIWTLPPDDADFSLRWNLIKGGFARALPCAETIAASRRGKRERGIWQRRFWEHLIRDETDLGRHVDYVHINPVKHGHVARASKWPYSSIHRYIRRGWLTADWACEPEVIESSGEATA